MASISWLDDIDKLAQSMSGAIQFLAGARQTLYSGRGNWRADLYR